MNPLADRPAAAPFFTIELNVLPAEAVRRTSYSPEISGCNALEPPEEDVWYEAYEYLAPDGTPLDVTHNIATAVSRRAHRLANLRLFLYRVNMVFITIGMLAGILLTYFQWRQQAFSNEMSTIQTCLAIQQMPDSVTEHPACSTVLNKGVLSSRAVPLDAGDNQGSSEAYKRLSFSAPDIAIALSILIAVWLLVVSNLQLLLSRLQKLRHNSLVETTVPLSPTIHVPAHVPRIISAIRRHQAAEHVRKRFYTSTEEQSLDSLRRVESVETLVQDHDDHTTRDDQTDGTKTPESDLSRSDSKQASIMGFRSETSSSETEDTTSKSDPGPEPEPEPDLTMSCSSSECGDDGNDNKDTDPFYPITPQTTNGSSNSLVVDDLIDLAVSWRARVYRELEAKRQHDTHLSDEVRAYHHLTYSRSASLALDTQLTAPVVPVTVTATQPWPSDGEGGSIPQFICRHRHRRNSTFSGFRDLSWHMARHHRGDVLNFVCPRDDCGLVCETAEGFFEHLADGHRYSAQAHKAGFRRGSWMSGHYMLMAP